MNVYKIELHVKREKVLVIKMLRCINPDWGLKVCKDFAEREFTWDSFMTEYITFEITVTAEQLGDLCAFSIVHFSRVTITEASVAAGIDPFNFVGAQS